MGTTDKKIVIVGAGIAGVRCVEYLASAGFKDITVVSESQFFGGLCVHQGCIPMELFWKSPREEIAETSVPTEMAAYIESSVKNAADFIEDRVVEVKLDHVITSTQAKISFDQLILATGNRTKNSEGVSSSISLRALWELKNKRIVLINHRFLEVWSLVAMLLEKNCEVAVINLFEKKHYDFPSFQEFREGLPKLVPEFFNFKNLNLAALDSKSSVQQIDFEHQDGFSSIEFDEVFVWGSDEPALPTIAAGAKFFLVGDVAGTGSATEAEMGAYQICQYLRSGKEAPLGGVLPRQSSSALHPLRIHAHKSWASVGDVQNLSAQQVWNRVDFNRLGWSSVHREDGALWYLFDASSQKVTAIQIYHSLASELISTASLLIDVPVTNNLWHSSFVHPSASEIFWEVALQCRAGAPLEDAKQPGPIVLSIPRWSYTKLTGLEAEYGKALISSLVLSENPQVALAICVLNATLGAPQDLLLRNPNQALKNETFSFDENRRKILIVRDKTFYEISII